MSISSIPSSQAEYQEWIELPLLELIEPLESGSRPKGGVRGIDSGIPSVGGEHLTAGGGFNFAKVKFVPKSFYASMRRGHIRRGDILIVKDGATTGKVALVRDDFPFEEAVVNEHVFIIRPKSDHDSRYIFWYLHSKEGQERVLEHFQGAAQGGINQQFAPGTLVPIPPTWDDEVTIADQIDGLVEGLQSPRDRLATIPTLLKKFRQSVLAAACSGQLTVDWREANPETETGQSIVAHLLTQTQDKKLKINSEQPDVDIPESWAWAAIGRIAAIRGGIQKQPHRAPKGNAYPYLRVANVGRNRLDLTEMAYFELASGELETYRLEQGDLLVVEGNGSFSEIGRASIWRNEIADCVHQNHIIRVRFSRILPEFVNAFWNSPVGIEQVTSTAVTTSGLYSLSTGKIASLMIPVPGRDEQAEIVRRVESLFGLADSIESRLAEATAQVERTTQAILAKAFRGEL